MMRRVTLKELSSVSKIELKVLMTAFHVLKLSRIINPK
jgi:hypothetical protein